MNKKNKILSISIVFLLLLCGLFTQAPAKTITTENKKIEKQPYVDPNIHLTKTLLPKLKQTIKNIENQQYKEVLQKIIEKLETKGTVESNDIKKILIELNMLNTEIYSGRITCSAGYDCTLYSFPLFFIPCFPPIWGWLGPAFYSRWKCAPNPLFDNNYVNLKINDMQINRWHNGFALAPTGAWTGQQVIYPGMRTGSEIWFFAYCLFIMITYT